MKITCSVCVIIMLLCNMAYAQSSDTTIQKILDIHLLNASQAKDFEAFLKEKNYKGNSNYIYALFQVEYKSITGAHFENANSYLNFGDKKPSPEAQTKIDTTLQSYLQKLQSCNLITTQQYNEQQQQIINNQYVHVLQMLADMASKGAYDDWLAPDKIMKYAEMLLANNIITAASFEALKNATNKGDITSQFQLIDYCKNAVFFDLSKYSDDPAVYIPQIHTKISELLPELHFSDFNYKIEVEDSSNNYTSYKLTVSLKAGDKIYKKKSFISPKDIGKNGNYLGKIDEQECYQLFNKILADHQSPFRLHQIKTGSRTEGFNTYRYFGIIALNKQQADTLHHSGNYLDISYEHFKNTLTSNRIDSAIQLYQQIGLLKHLSSSQIATAKEQIKEQENPTLNYVLERFPDVIYNFDTELSNLDDPYAELIKEYGKISHGAFNPINIADDFNIEHQKKVTLRFQFNGTSYNKPFAIKDDWLDTDFFEFMQNIVSENKLDGQFYDLYTGGQDASVIYLTKVQYDFLKANKLLIFGDEWNSEDEQ